MDATIKLLPDTATPTTMAPPPSTMNKSTNNPKDLLSFDPAAVAIKAASNQKEGLATLKQLKGFATSLLHYIDIASDQIIDVDLTGETSDNGDSNDRAEEVTTSADAAELPSNSEHNRGKRRQHQPRNREVVETTFKRHKARLPPSGAHVGNATVSGPPLLPRTLPMNYYGTLQESTIRRSPDDGIGKYSLNACLEYLGLKAKFVPSAISTYGTSGVAHLTFEHKWNDAPRNESETIEWWLGEGKDLLKLAERLDPSLYEQSDDGIPVFWAVSQPSGRLCGREILYYIGHYKCIRFVRNLNVMSKGTTRQALIELKFIKFDEVLSNKMSHA